KALALRHAQQARQHAVAIRVERALEGWPVEAGVVPCRWRRHPMCHGRFGKCPVERVILHLLVLADTPTMDKDRVIDMDPNEDPGADFSRRKAMRMPAFYIPHGAGPCFFMDWNPPGTWHRMAGFLEGIAASLPAAPRAVALV